MSVSEALQEAANKANASVPATTTQPSVPATTGQRMGVSQFRTTARTQVDAYLKVTHYGMTVGKGSGLVKSFKAQIDLSKIKYCTQVRFGQPAQYHKTFDGLRTADGTNRPWSDILALGKQIDPSKRSDPYPTAEIFMTVTSDVKDADGNEVATTGQILSYTPPYTGGDALAQLLNAVEDAGGNVERSVVNVVVGFTPQAKDANKWGNVTWTFESIVE